MCSQVVRAMLRVAMEVELIKRDNLRKHSIGGGGGSALLKVAMLALSVDKAVAFQSILLGEACVAKKHLASIRLNLRIFPLGHVAVVVATVFWHDSFISRTFS